MTLVLLDKLREPSQNLGGRRTLETLQLRRDGDQLVEDDGQGAAVEVDVRRAVGLRLQIIQPAAPSSPFDER